MELYNNKQIENLPLIVLIPRVLLAIIILMLTTIIIFRLRLGEFSMLSVGFGVFLVTIEVLFIIGIRFYNRTEVHVTKKPKWDWLDKLGGVWLFACAFGAFFAWIFLQFGEYGSIFQILAIIFSIVLPFVTMLPNLRYLQSNSFYVQIPLLTIVTFLPMMVGVLPAISLYNKYFN